MGPASRHRADRHPTRPRSAHRERWDRSLRPVPPWLVPLRDPPGPLRAARAPANALRGTRCHLHQDRPNPLARPGPTSSTSATGPSSQNSRTPRRSRSRGAQAQLVGTLTKSLRLTIITADNARVNFTLAVDGYNSTTDYITCFGRLAENVAEYTDKGHLVAIEGRITSGKYTNDQGETVYTLDIIANNVKFLKAPKSATTTAGTVEGEVA